jgi:hypothetical protein
MAKQPREDFEEDDENVVSSVIPYRNVPALVGYYLGVFSLIPCLGLVLGPAAVILGIVGLRGASRQPKKKGMGHAITALILGGLTSLGNYGAVAVMVIAALASKK